MRVSRNILGFGCSFAALSVSLCTSAHAEDAGDDTIIVTASRTEQKRENVATAVEVVTAKQLQAVFGDLFIDQLKKTAGVDVVQYPNGQSGFGLRGQRPDFDFGINPRTLTLVDGRPSGSAGAGSISPESIERVEVLKGPSSALYGPSAIGGVINIITKKSKGPIHGSAQLGYGSYDTIRGNFAVGGSFTQTTDFDLGIGYVNQGDDFKTGAGDERPNSDFKRFSVRFRVGADLSDIVRADASVDHSDIHNHSAGRQSDVPAEPSDTRVKRTGGDIRLMITPQDHKIRLVGYTSDDIYRHFEAPLSTPRYITYDNLVRTTGVQIQDSWTVAPILSITYGFDWQKAEIERTAFTPKGVTRAAYAPDEDRKTTALFAEAMLSLLEERLILTFGAREDWIKANVHPMALNPDVQPGNSSFSVFTPRGGIVFKLTDALRIHATAGEGFAPPQGSELAGSSTTIATSGQVRVSYGNPDLKPEKNRSWDIGIGYASGPVFADLTYFDSKTTDKIQSTIVVSTPELRETTYINTNSSRMRGLEGQFGLDIGALAGLAADRVTLTANATHMFKAQDDTLDVLTPVRNVPKWKANVVLAANDGKLLSGAISVNYNGHRWDRDYSTGSIFAGVSGGWFEAEAAAIVDANIALRLASHSRLRFDVTNLFDKNYYNMADYPMRGRTFNARYSLSF